MFNLLGGSTRAVYNALLKESPLKSRHIARRINKHRSTVSESIKKLTECGLVSRDGWWYSIVEDVDWGALNEEFSLDLQMKATRDVVEEERQNQREKIKRWHDEQ